VRELAEQLRACACLQGEGATTLARQAAQASPVGGKSAAAQPRQPRGYSTDSRMDSGTCCHSGRPLILSDGLLVLRRTVGVGLLVESAVGGHDLLRRRLDLGHGVKERFGLDKVVDVLALGGKVRLSVGFQLEPHLPGRKTSQLENPQPFLGEGVGDSANAVAAFLERDRPSGKDAHAIIGRACGDALQLLAVGFHGGDDREGDDFHLPAVNELVIYEMHLGTFHDKEDGKSDKFEEALQKLDHLQRLGVNAIELMPLAEFAGELSWGYNPACVFAVETAYGGPAGFKRFVKAVHRSGLGVILDVVYNHFGPGDLDLWQFDGWSENGLGGIYFYNDWHAETPWGSNRPDYGRKELRQFIRDNALMWLEEYHVDGLRLDMTLFLRNVRGNGDPGDDLPDGWSLIQWINREVRERYPGRVPIAEDLQNDDRLTKPVDQGGAGFTAQWAAPFVHPVRVAVITPSDEQRSLDSVRGAIEGRYNGDPFQRVIYSESHDEVADGKARYDEAHHLSGKPQEAVSLYRAIDAFCMSLEPSAVTRRYLAKTVNYEYAGRPFCSVHVLHGGLKVWVALRFKDITAPPAFARDVAHVGHWGAGDVELRISNQAELLEAQRVVHQSFEAARIAI